MYRMALAGLALGVAAVAQAVMPLAQASTPGPAVIHTVPSALVGGLPIKSLDGTKEYIPQGKAPLAAKSGKISHTAGNPWTTGATGYDISWPNCPAHNPVLPPDSDVAVVGVNDGTPFTALPCLSEAAAWSPNGTHAQYMILDSPIGSTSAAALQYAFHGPAGDCTATDYKCQGFNWGYNAANYSVGISDAAGIANKTWWLDVELPTADSINPPGADCYAANFWTCDTTVNNAIVVGAVAELKLQHKTAGVYSTQQQWGKITGGLPLSTPIWIAGWNSPAATYCDPASASADWFAGGKPWLIQSLPTVYDPDTAC
jgi:hypothetical protein